jgi:nitrogen regulatory protein PII
MKSKGMAGRRTISNSIGAASTTFLPKVEITIWAEDAVAEKLAKEIAGVAHTGLMGDGKIFMTDATWPEAIEF